MMTETSHPLLTAEEEAAMLADMRLEAGDLEGCYFEAWVSEASADEFWYVDVVDKWFSEIEDFQKEHSDDSSDDDDYDDDYEDDNEDDEYELGDDDTDDTDEDD